MTNSGANSQQWTDPEAAQAAREQLAWERERQQKDAWEKVNAKRESGRGDINQLLNMPQLGSQTSEPQQAQNPEQKQQPVSAETATAAPANAEKYGMRGVEKREQTEQGTARKETLENRQRFSNAAPAAQAAAPAAAPASGGGQNRLGWMNENILKPGAMIGLAGGVGLAAANNAIATMPPFLKAIPGVESLTNTALVPAWEFLGANVRWAGEAVKPVLDYATAYLPNIFSYLPGGLETVVTTTNLAPIVGSAGVLWALGHLRRAIVNSYYGSEVIPKGFNQSLWQGLRLLSDPIVQPIRLAANAIAGGTGWITGRLKDAKEFIFGGGDHHAPHIITRTWNGLKWVAGKAGDALQAPVTKWMVGGGLTAALLSAMPTYGAGLAWQVGLVTGPLAGAALYAALKFFGLVKGGGGGGGGGGHDSHGGGGHH